MQTALGNSPAVSYELHKEEQPIILKSKCVRQVRDTVCVLSSLNSSVPSLSKRTEGQTSNVNAEGE